MKSPTNHTSVAKAEQRGLGTDDEEASHSRPSFMPLQNFCVVVVVVVVAFSLLARNLGGFLVGFFFFWGGRGS